MAAKTRTATAHRIAATMLVLATACTTGADRIRVLERDPLAEVDLSMAVDVRRSSNPGNVDLGVPSPTVIRHTFTVPEDAVDAGIDELVTTARDAGWTVIETEFGFSGDKTVGGLSTQLLIDSLPTEGLVWIEIYTRDS